MLSRPVSILAQFAEGTPGLRATVGSFIPGYSLGDGIPAAATRPSVSLCISPVTGFRSRHQNTPDHGVPTNRLRDHPPPVSPFVFSGIPAYAGAIVASDSP